MNLEGGHMLGYDDYQKSIDAMDEQGNQFKKGHYWVFINMLKDGRFRWVNIGSQRSYEEAQTMALDQCGNNSYKIISFPTNQTAEAQRMFKKWILTQSKDINEATALISRKPAIEQKQKQKDQSNFGGGRNGFV